ncbi:MAG: helix-turn-helix domain-containing protein [Thermoleophilia bacterium]
MFEIGNTLREARLRRGLDIADCEVATKIRTKYLRALEDEHFDLLPSPAYVRGFLRSYADFLELDGQLVIDEYESRFGNHDPIDHDRWGRTPGAPAAAPAAPGRRRTRASARRAGPTPGNRRRTEAQLLWLAIGGVLGVGLLIQLGAGNRQTPPPFTPTTSTKPDTVPATDPKLATSERPVPVRVTFTGLGTTGAWLEVHARNKAGRRVYYQVLGAGSTKTFNVDQSLWFTTANAVGLRVTVNGKHTPLTGANASYQVSRRGLVPSG